MPGLSTAQCTGPCSAGHFCPAGSSKPKEHRCPPGRYGARQGLMDRGCDGPCPAGYYCSEGATTPQPCGSDGFFCPTSSGRPLPVQPGYYSTGGTNTTRTGEVACPPGSYCTRGIRQPCPAGTYGMRDKLSSPACDGRCAVGSFCPEGSSLPNATPCPAGTYGDREGLTSSECSGQCRPGFECQAGSSNQYSRITH